MTTTAKTSQARHLRKSQWNHYQKHNPLSTSYAERAWGHHRRQPLTHVGNTAAIFACTPKGAAHTAAVNYHGIAPQLPREGANPNHAMAFMLQGAAEIPEKEQGTYDARPVYPDKTAETLSTHGGKEAATGDELNPLIAWYSLVATLIPREQCASMPRAQAAVDAEWTKLRNCDGGRGTWDESLVREYWDVQTEAKTKLDATIIHTHFGTLSDLCVGKDSKLEEARRRYKGRCLWSAPHPRRIRFGRRVP